MSNSEQIMGKTMLKRIEQHRDRWTSYGANTGLTWISEKLSPAELRDSEIFQPFDDKFLERISPDVSVAVWDPDSVLFEEGSYIDLAFFIDDGEVDVSLEKIRGSQQSRPIFDGGRSGVFTVPAAIEPSANEAPEGESRSIQHTRILSVEELGRLTRRSRDSHEIAFLSAMDFDLPAGSAARLGPGELFGEIGALSGWPQSVTARTVTPCRLVQIRLPALRLMKRKSKALKQRIDAIYRERSLLSQLERTPILSACSDASLAALKESVELVSCDPDEVVVRQGEPADALYLVRSGFVKLQQRIGDGDMVVSYLSKGMTLGEVELLIDGLDRWETTARSVEYAELVKIPADAVRRLLEREPGVEKQLWDHATSRIREMGYSRREMAHSEFTQTALETGLVQGSSILVIDTSVCTRCDDCVRGCAATHGGRPRFVREGSKLGTLMVPRSCYHCRDPVCLVGCPTGAIHRAGVDRVVEISDEICIGCTTCATSCPYDAIVMHDTGEQWPDDMVPTSLRGEGRRLASKCDLCHDTGHDPACVSNCPQGCAYRVDSLETLRDLMGKGA